MYPMVKYTELYSSRNSFNAHREIFEANRLYVIPISRKEAAYSDIEKSL